MTTEHTVESLMALYHKCLATRQHHKSAEGYSYENVSDADEALKTALTEVFDALAEAKADLRDANLHIKQLERGLDKAMKGTL